MSFRKMNVSLNSSNNPKLKLFIKIQSGDFIEKSDFKIEKDFFFSYPVYGGNGLIGYTNKYNVLPNTIVVGRVGALCGNVHFIKERAWITDNSLFLNILITDKLEYKFLYYLLKSFNLNQYSRSTAQPLITSKTIKDRTAKLPSIMDQERISRFISIKTIEIDDLIVDKEKLVKLLEEKRQAVITEAVTKGIDPNVKKKDSGVEWIGEIPEHWGISKVKYVSDINKQALLESTNKDFEFNYIDIGSVNSSGELIKVERMSFENAPSRARRIINQGDTLVSTVRTYLRAITWIENGVDTLIASTGYAVLTPKSKIENKFLSFLMRSNSYIDKIVSMSVGVSYPATNSSDIGNLSFIFPPFEEQKAIVNCIDMQIKGINNLKKELNLQINKIKEYRQSLIYEAITGKIDIQDMMNEIK